MEDIHYYPFGGRHKGYLGFVLTPGIDEIERVSLRAVPTPSQSSGSDNYHYKYNQKELQIESGFYDYGWRQYMPDIGRWNGIDQLAESYHNINPYAYVANNPISFTDPDGRKISRGSNGIWEVTGGDADLLIAFINAGGSTADFLKQLSSYESSGSDFGSGPISNFWGSFNSGGLFIGGINSSTSYTYWTTTVANNSSSEDEVALDGIQLNIKKTSSDSFKYVFEEEGIGQPGEWESLIPIWGSGRAAIDHFQNGNYWTGAAYTALAVSDVFLVKSLATGLSRGAWKLGSHSWSATRKWMLKNGYAGKGEPLHHWAITQSTSKKYGLEAIANQPWNMVKFSNQSMHMRAGHGMNYLGQPGYNVIGQAWYGTPTWFKAGTFSTIGHGIQFGSY
ncbi:RHS repeat-associated core domain-containing protein [Empedobacter falsenii]|uniref:RHS repeat-associated core domain-containing protein n=1 Tax=Empedobacter falsenii TaxID=343874 RepID=A0AAW7DMG6_9FLAO|nr:RHS repeat-associated core domain-containing protein [Empedobacter falsenii]MDM1552838.1 RHS repeat-associated core domain-containing protein [Empedobacter falsenii]